LAELSTTAQRELRRDLGNLPSWIVLFPTRALVPLMATCSRDLLSNFLTIEGVAAGVALDAAVVVSIQSPTLTQAAAAQNVPVEIVPSH
jgi:hypothetical protein